MAKLISPKKIVDVYNSRQLGATFSEIEDKLGLNKTYGWKIYDNLEKHGHRGRKKYKNYIEAWKMIKAQSVAKVKNGEIKQPVTPEIYTYKADDPYAVLEAAFKQVETAIEGVILHEVDKRTKDVKKEYQMLREEAKHSNWIENLRNKFS